MSWIIEKYRKEAEWHFNNNYHGHPTWRAAILESIFRPKIVLPPGKGPMTHLHPDIDKLHLPEGAYIADWRKYRVEDHPALMNYQKRCHAAGLHDPWLRNYCCTMYPNVMTTRSRMAVVTQGLGCGFLTALLIYTLQKISAHYYPPAPLEHTPEYIAKHGTSGDPHH